MQLVKNVDSINQISHQHHGDLGIEASYTSSMYARCPLCGEEAFVTRREQGPQSHKAIFRCSSCFHQFEPSVTSIFWT
jgi:hypothetical protein